MTLEPEICGVTKRVIQTLETVFLLGIVLTLIDPVILQNGKVRINSNLIVVIFLSAIVEERVLVMPNIITI